MNKLTYKEAYDLIIDAYFKNEIKPLLSMFCFCGTLCNNSMSWNYADANNQEVFQRYTKYEYKKMEQRLLDKLHHEEGHPLYEQDLFAGMVAALDELRIIHLLRDEEVDEPPVKFRKRELSKI